MTNTMTIRNWLTNAVIWEGEAETMVSAIQQALNAGKSLRYANLSHTNLSHTDLSHTDLSYANLSYADLTHADLTHTDLSYANLSYANLSYTNLSYTNLTRANLSYTNLSYTNLSYTNLTRANLTRANLTDADTSLARVDIRSILTAAPAEVEGLKRALVEGRVDGRAYEGSCACLIGTIANVRQCHYDELVDINPELRPNSFRPAEIWFLGIRKGQTPENHPVAALTLAWIEQWEADARAVALVYGQPK